MTSDRSLHSNRTTGTTTSRDAAQQQTNPTEHPSGERAPVRIRFAPSPTGFQHIGGFRTALFDWLFARHYDGQFLLRIEDTDTARTVPGAVDAILEGFRWLGMEWDEGPIVGGVYGPYFQTQRLDLYRSAAHRLMAGGFAYPCFCTPERLQMVRESMRARGEPPRYDRHCRPLSPEERARRIAAGEPYVVRLAVPEQGTTRVHDELRGEILFENATLDDAVLLKSNGYPTYHLAHVVDDHLMAITHVIRAEEWIPSAPLHVIEYAALGWELPRLVHVPDVLGHDGKKLSKRHGALPLLAYRDMGYLPEALLNYMALLGWSYDDKTDILSPDQIIAAFTLDRVGTSAARFDAERLLWMNGVYIRRLTPEALVEQTLPFLERREAEGGLPDSVERPLDRGYARRVLLLEQERMKTLADAAPATAFFFEDELEYAPELLIAKQMDAQRTLKGLGEAQAVLSAQPEWEAPLLEHAARELVASLGLKPGQLFASLRVAVTGRTVSPPLFETMEVLGRQRSLERIAVAIARLESRAA
jgi:glutamyl-tRNA synthetase